MKKTVFFLILFSVLVVAMAVGFSFLKNFLPGSPDDGQYLKRVSESGKNGKQAGTEVMQKVSAAEKQCTDGAYGMDCEVVKYLEKNLAPGVEKGANFCSYELFTDPGNELYVYALCEQFYASDSKIYESLGLAVPARLRKTENVYSLWVPRDGSQFTQDIRQNFPKSFQSEALNYDMAKSERLAKINRSRAESYFSANFDYTVEKTLKTACKNDIDCATPMEYLAMSRCPFTTKCLDSKCSVICPSFRLIPAPGK